MNFFNKYFGEGTKWGLAKCEMCGKICIRRVEVGLYWVCDTEECISKADVEVNLDIDEFLKQVEKD